MHRALFVSEILLEVFTHLMIPDQPLYEESVTYWHELDYRKFFSTKNTLSSDHNRYLARLSFAALARTCKTFHEPAMDFLWADTDDYGIGPLLGCVTRLHPLIYYDRHGGKKQAPDWSGVEPISEHEAHQFLRYAARVRYLSIRTKIHFHLLTVFPILEARMFPRLLALEWKPYTNTMLHLFLSPTVRRCALTDVHSDSKYIGTLCNRLESLSIWGEVTLEAYDLSLLSESVRSCKRLKHLRCPSLDFAAWKYLSNLPTLVTLEICKGPYNALLDRDKIILSPFLNVTALTFHSRSAADIITIIQHSEFPSLKEFGASVDVLPWLDSEQLFHALARCKACHTLEIIHVAVFYPAIELSVNTSTAIKQLLCFPQLRALRLSI